MYDSTPLKTRLADKYLVREYVREKIGDKYLTKLLGIWSEFDEIDFDELPSQFVLKANHGCGYNCIVTDKSKMNISEMRRKFQEWMDTNYAFEYGFELQYRDIPRVIIAEEYLKPEKGQLSDYKITCINGEPKYIQVINDRDGLKIRIAVYDTDWKRQKFTFGQPAIRGDVPRPHMLDELLEAAGKLSKGFALVRVDLYDLDDREIKFGEMTFTPASGGQKWIYPEYNNKLGDMIVLPQKYYLPGISYEFEKKNAEQTVASVGENR